MWNELGEGEPGEARWSELGECSAHRRRTAAWSEHGEGEAGELSRWSERGEGDAGELSRWSEHGERRAAAWSDHGEGEAREHRAALWSDARETVLMQSRVLEEALAAARRGEAVALSEARAFKTQLLSLEACEQALGSDLRSARVQVVRLTEEASELRSALGECQQQHVDEARLRTELGARESAHAQSAQNAQSAQHTYFSHQISLTQSLRSAAEALSRLQLALEKGACSRSTARADLATSTHSLLAAIDSAAVIMAELGPSLGEGGAHRLGLACAQIRGAESLALRVHVASVSNRANVSNSASVLNSGGEEGAYLEAELLLRETVEGVGRALRLSEAEVERARALRSEADLARLRADAEQMRQRVAVEATISTRSLREARQARDLAQARAAELAEANHSLERHAARFSEALRKRQAAEDEATALRSYAAASRVAQVGSGARAVGPGRGKRAGGSEFAPFSPPTAQRASGFFRSEYFDPAADRLLAKGGFRRDAQGGFGGDSQGGFGGDAQGGFGGNAQGGFGGDAQETRGDPALRVGGGYTTVGEFMRALSPPSLHTRLDSEEGDPSDLADMLRALSPHPSTSNGNSNSNGNPFRSFSPAGAIVRGGRGSKLRVVPSSGMQQNSSAEHQDKRGAAGAQISRKSSPGRLLAEGRHSERGFPLSHQQLTVGAGARGGEGGAGHTLGHTLGHTSVVAPALASSAAPILNKSPRISRSCSSVGGR
ncbi:hypothetical protein T492DRAFT_1035550 [Pavlovales sp. CCMP2436]|nr:hypothetical protein T492DRAFT_1035550 [Pavlovales sp. CCMP2436]